MLYDAIAEKVSKIRAVRIAMNTTDSSASLTALRELLLAHPIAELEEILVVHHGARSRLWP